MSDTANSQTMPERKDYVLGLDLGQAADYTALCVLERWRSTCKPSRYDCRHLERFKLGTSYPTIVERVIAIANSAELKACQRRLVVDATGVGAPVVDLLRRAPGHPPVIAVTITGGNDVTRDGSNYGVPKRDLVSVLQVLFQTGRLKIADALPNAPVLLKELLSFQVKIDLKTAHDSYGAWREGTHDDLVLSVAMACWFGERAGRASADWV